MGSDIPERQCLAIKTINLNPTTQMLKSIILIAAAAIAVPMTAKNVTVTSPDGSVRALVSVEDEVGFTVCCGNDTVFTSNGISMILRDRTLGGNPVLKSVRTGSVNETSECLFPISDASVRNDYNYAVLNMKGGYSIEFRAFDEGIAYRFITDFGGSVEVLDEKLSASFPHGTSAVLSLTGGFKTSYEQPYSKIRLEEFRHNGQMSYLPVLFNVKGTGSGTEYSILMSEADLRDYPCMFLKSDGKGGLVSVFPKCPLSFGEDGDRSVRILEEAHYIASTSGTRTYPWRFMVISDNDRDIASNHMVHNLSSPCEISDCSWIRPGKVSWEWWNGASVYGPDVDFESGFNLETYKYFIDFAAEYGIEYLLMDEGWALSTRDPYTPNPRVDVHEIIRYGKEKGVGVFLWLTWLTVENNFDLFKTFEDWGIAGVKIDFMDRSDQWMVNYYERVAKEAADHKLLVDFHGSFKPAGLEIRYPNVLSYEGVLGMEQMGGCKPDNSLYLPFIRNAVGPMDYTPGAMISMQPEVYRSERPNSASIGTRAYQMALYTVFKSGIQMLADSPTMYYRNPECTEFIASVPVIWDESKVLEAKAGEYIIIARRSGEKWFIGAICNGKERERVFTVSLGFLDKGRSYSMTAFEDSVNSARQAMDYRMKKTSVESGDSLQIKMVRNGGWTAVLE